MALVMLGRRPINSCVPFGLFYYTLEFIGQCTAAFWLSAVFESAEIAISAITRKGAQRTVSRFLGLYQDRRRVEILCTADIEIQVSRVTDLFLIQPVPINQHKPIIRHHPIIRQLILLIWNSLHAY